MLAGKSIQEVSDFLLDQIGWDPTSFEEVKKVYHSAMEDSQAKVKRYSYIISRLYYTTTTNPL